MNEMENHNISKFNELSLGDLFNGIILFIDDRKFTEQQLYKFFYDLASEDSSLGTRLRFKGITGNLKSEPLRRILTFREMGKLVEVAMPNPVDQAYCPRASQLDSLRKDMENTCVLPNYESLLKELANKFLASLN
jgi:hypothetical protein